MFSRKTRRESFEREVRIEMELLRKLHGDSAARIAAEKAARPTNRTARRKVLEETASRLDGKAPPVKWGLLSRIFG